MIFFLRPALLIKTICAVFLPASFNGLLEALPFFGKHWLFFLVKVRIEEANSND